VDFLIQKMFSSNVVNVVFKDICHPYGLVFGGTDVNIYGCDPRYSDIMLHAVIKARFVMLH